MTNQRDKDARTLDRITREVGLADMNEGTSTAEDRRWARDLVVSYRDKIAEARRALVPEAPPIKKAEPIKKPYLAMARDALEALFAARTRTWGPQLQLAHRKLDTLSDDDLRRLVQLLEPSPTE